MLRERYDGTEINTRKTSPIALNHWVRKSSAVLPSTKTAYFLKISVHSVITSYQHVASHILKIACIALFALKKLVFRVRLSFKTITQKNISNAFITKIDFKAGNRVIFRPSKRFSKVYICIIKNLKWH